LPAEDKPRSRSNQTLDGKEGGGMRLAAKLSWFPVLLFAAAAWAGRPSPSPPPAPVPALGDGGILALGAVLIGAGIAGIARARRK